MKNVKSKKALWIIGAILIVLMLVLLLSQCGKDDIVKQRDTSGEIIVDEKESEDGLVIVEPEDSDEASEEDTVEFVNPDGSTGNGSIDKESTDRTDDVRDTDSKTDNDKIDSDKVGNEKTESDKGDTTQKEEGNLNEESDSKGKYGDFF